VREPLSNSQQSGLASLLGEQSHVYYDTLYSTRHIGRVTDLFCAKMRASGPDERSLRAILLFGLIDAYFMQVETKVEGSAPPCVVVECGTGLEKMGAGVSFGLPQSMNIDAEGLSERIQEGRPASSLECLLGQLLGHSEQVVLRWFRETRTVEIFSVQSIDAVKVSGKTEKPSFLFVQIDEVAPTLISPLEPQSYLQLADVDYAKLLNPDREKTRKALGSELERSSRGSWADKEEVFIVKGDGKDMLNREEIRIAGRGQKNGSNDTEDAVSRPAVNKLKKMIRAIWPFKKGTKAKVAQESQPSENLTEDVVQDFAPENAPENASEREEKAEVEQNKKKGSQSHGSDAASAGDSSSGEESSQPEDLTHEISSGLNRAVTKIHLEAEAIRKEAGTERLRGWMDGMLRELGTERSRITELAKRSGQSLRHKEAEFRLKEQRYLSELRERDQFVRSKETP